jgi:hypothetical protein
MNFEAFVEKIREAGYEPRSYSGRGMFGKVCVGVDLDRNDRGEDLPGGASEDSMGLGYIMYWPHVEWVETEEVE